MMIEGINEFTIYEVEKLKIIFLKELENSDDYTLDMKSIEKLDIVGIQLLISLVKSANYIDKKVQFINITENALLQIDICNCRESLGILDD